MQKKLAEMPRIEFANQLRALAALSVVWLHLGLHYWVGRGFAFDHLGVTNLPAATAIPAWVPVFDAIQSLGTLKPRFDFGVFGVALFFLVSGFVVPLSLRRLGPAKFLLNRAIRIYPVYGVSVLILVALWWSVSAGSLGPGHGDVRPQQILADMLLVGDLFGWPPLNLVGWTLLIELRFYLVAALLSASLRRGAQTGVFAFALVIVAAAMLAKSPSFTQWLHGSLGIPGLFVLGLIASPGFVFVIYIFCGYLLLLFWEKRIGLVRLIVQLMVLFGLGVCSAYALSVPLDQLRLIVLNQLMALAVFIFAMNVRVHAGNRIVNKISAISYPLYAVHLSVGWATLAVLDTYGINDLVALLSAFAMVFLVAWLVHRFVELPSLRLIAKIR